MGESLARRCGVVVGVTFAISGPSSQAQVVTTTSSGGGSSVTVSDVVPAVTTPAFGTGALSGVVTDGKTGRPLEGALVHLSGGGQAPSGPRPGQITDSRGRFIFTHLPPFADYVVSAARAGYMAGGYKRAPGVTTTARIALGDTEWLQSADVQLWRPASITGVIRDEHGDPVVGVPVRALASVQVAGRRQQAAGPAAFTDDRGVYRLADLRPGEYLIHVPSVQITLPATTAPARPTAAGGRTGGPASATAALPNVPAIVRGEGLTGLMVDYYATPPAGSGAMAYAMAFHPSAPSVAQATSVSVAYGDQLENVDVQLSLVPTVTVSGRVTGPAGTLERVPVRLLPVGSESLAFGAEAAFTQTDADGEFTLMRVPAGDYTLIASRSVAEYTRSGPSVSTDIMPSAAIMITSMSMGQVSGADGVSFSSRSTPGTAVVGRIPISVGDRDLAGVTVPLSTGVKVSGHFLWDGQQAAPDTIKLQPTVRLEPADGDLSKGVRTRTTIRSGNEPLPTPLLFEVEGVLQGRYVIGQIESAGFVLEGIDLNGRNLLTMPLEVDSAKDVGGIVVRLTSRRITLSGAVRDGTGAPATSGTVLTFPASPALWRDFGLSASLFRTSSVVASGTYRVDRLLPGDYLMIAVPDEDRHKGTDPDFLASIAARATRVRVEPGATISQDLRIVEGRR